MGFISKRAFSHFYSFIWLFLFSFRIITAISIFGLLWLHGGYKSDELCFLESRRTVLHLINYEVHQIQCFGLSIFMSSLLSKMKLHNRAMRSSLILIYALNVLFSPSSKKELTMFSFHWEDVQHKWTIIWPVFNDQWNLPSLDRIFFWVC